jgi:hypothetical protein
MRDTSPDSAVVEKKLICVADIDGIVVRRSQIYPSELGHIIARDRAYVACEMTAFLVHWLRCLACPVVNMPSGVCLCGPMWSPFAWTHHAAQMGIPVVKQTRHGMRDQHRGATTEVVMLDGVRVAAQEDTVTSDADIRMSNYTRQLAVSSGARLLSARFMLSGGRPHFVGATPVPPVTQMLARALQVVITQSSVSRDSPGIGASNQK